MAFDKRYSKSQLKETVTKRHFFQTMLNRIYLYIIQYLPNKAFMQVAFNKLPLFLIISVDTQMNGNINSMTGRDDPQV